MRETVTTCTLAKARSLIFHPRYFKYRGVGDVTGTSAEGDGRCVEGFWIRTQAGVPTRVERRSRLPIEGARGVHNPINWI